MIVRDGADTVLTALSSVAPIADAYHVLDTGSSDATMEVVRSFAGRSPLPVHMRQMVWPEDFAASPCSRRGRCALAGSSSIPAGPTSTVYTRRTDAFSWSTRSARKSSSWTAPRGHRSVFYALPVPEGLEGSYFQQEYHHLNSMTADRDGWVLTAHGHGERGALWRVQSHEVEKVWPPAGAPALDQPHDGRRVSDDLLFLESGRGRLVCTAGWELYLGGWCRGLAPCGPARWVVGVNPFHDRPGPILSACLAVVQDRRVERVVPLGIPRPWQTYAIIPVSADVLKLE